VPQGIEDDLPITGAELSVAARIGATLRRLFRRPDPVAVLRRREAIKKEIREHMALPDDDNVPEILVVKLGKHDEYGKPDKRIIGRGASDWFKTEVKELGDRGLEVYTSLQYVKIRKEKAYLVHPDRTKGAIKVWVVGRIPYERIAHIDWEGDPGYSSPRFYVRYDWRRNPYREIALYIAERGEYPFEVPNVDYKGESGGPIKRLGRFAHRVRFNLMLRRQDRKRRREFTGRLT